MSNHVASPPTSTASTPRPLTGLATAAAHRWPTLLAVAAGAVSLAGPPTGGLEYTAVFLVAAVGYQIMAMTTRRALTWPLVLVLFGLVVGLRVTRIDEHRVLGVLAVALAVVGLALRLHGLRALQIPVALGLVTAAVLASAVPPAVGTVVVAAGLIGHAAWDVVQWRADAVIARSFAEWCAVFDVVVGVGLLVTLVV